MCGCMRDEAKTLIAAIVSCEHTNVIGKCIRWSSSAARGGRNAHHCKCSVQRAGGQ